MAEESATNGVVHRPTRPAANLMTSAPLDHHNLTGTMCAVAAAGL